MASELKLSFEFDRYVNGTLMAEGVTIERASTLDKAMVAAARIAPKGPNGETPVLVYRPAPAATDTGLVTVEYQVRSKLNGHWVKDNFLSQQLSPDTERRELVTRSQAGAIIAELQAKAKDYREYSERLEKRLESEEATRSQAVELLAAERDKVLFLKTAMEIAQTHCGLKDKTIDKLEADNAAKAARIKELEEALDSDPSGSDLWRYWSRKACEASQKYVDEVDRAKALEAKLAAAENGVRYALANLRMNKSDEAFLAAVLGGKPS